MDERHDASRTEEEIRSANEEVQTTNEELRTSKEELESMNEELNTLYRVVLKGPTDFTGPAVVESYVYLPVLAIHILLAIVAIPLVAGCWWWPWP